MEGKEISLKEILICREKRVETQKNLIYKYNSPLISFSMNIPGAIKTNTKIKKAFNIGKEELLKELNIKKIKIFEIIEVDETTGNELFIVAETKAEILKKITMKIEEKNEIGRFFDMDVIDINGYKLSRKTFRKCFICDNQAQECSRSRKHSLEELQQKIMEILDKYF